MRSRVYDYVRDKQAKETKQNDWTITTYDRDKTEWLGKQAGQDFMQCRHKDGLHMELSVSKNTVELYVDAKNEAGSFEPVLKGLPANAQHFMLTKEYPTIEQFDHSAFVLYETYGGSYKPFYVDHNRKTVTEVQPANGRQREFQSAVLVLGIELSSQPGNVSDTILGQLLSSMNLKQYPELGDARLCVLTLNLGTGNNRCILWKTQDDPDYMYNEIRVCMGRIAYHIPSLSTILSQLRNLTTRAALEFFELKDALVSLSKSDRAVELWKIQETLRHDTKLRPLYENLQSVLSQSYPSIVEQMDYIASENLKKYEASSYGRTYVPPHDIAELLLQIDVEAERARDNNNNNRNDTFEKMSGIPYFGTLAYDDYVARQAASSQRTNARPAYMELNNKKRKPFNITAVDSDNGAGDQHFQYIENIEDSMSIETKTLGRGYTLVHAISEDKETEVLTFTEGAGHEFVLSRKNNEVFFRVIFDRVPGVMLHRLRELLNETSWNKMFWSLETHNSQRKYTYFVPTYESAGFEISLCKTSTQHMILKEFIKNLSAVFYQAEEMQSLCAAMISRATTKCKPEPKYEPSRPSYDSDDMDSLYYIPYW